ncbi:MAG: helix-turn-helix domain-containing protein [Micrococcaceae bacterium]|nr:helix-turn-helix domain-containing protein [Micrococcaceae bacterium]
MNSISPLKLLDWAVELHLPQAQKVTLLVLVKYADKEYTCYPGQTKLAENTGMSIRSVRNALNELEKVGIIHREKRYLKNGTRTSDRCFLNIDYRN